MGIAVHAPAFEQEASPDVVLFFTFFIADVDGKNGAFELIFHCVSPLFSYYSLTNDAQHYNHY
jgi:hypothetical protein